MTYLTSLALRKIYTYMYMRPERVLILSATEKKIYLGKRRCIIEHITRYYCNSRMKVPHLLILTRVYLLLVYLTLLKDHI